MGVAYGTVRDYFWDPTAAKARARKESYRGACRRCARRTSGGDGPQAARALCQRCKGGQHAGWTRERVVEVLLAFEACFARRPTSYDLNPTVARRRGGRALARYEAYGLSAGQVHYLFGSFAAALDAAFGPDAPAAEAAGEPRAA